MNTRVKPFNVNLICRTPLGAPSFFACVVLCTEDQYENGDHIDMVCEAAENVGLTVPGFGQEGNEPIICDENDSLGVILDYGSDWESATKLDLEEYYLAKSNEVTVEV